MGFFKGGSGLRDSSLYYLGVRLLCVVLVVVAEFVKGAFADREFITFAAALYGAFAVWVFLRPEGALPSFWQRLIDYGFALLLTALATDLTAVLPVGVILATYSVLFWGEYALLVALVVIVLSFKTFFGGSFSVEDFLVGLIFLLGLSLASSKVNLISWLTHQLERLRSIRAENRKVHRACASLSAELQVYRGAEEILEKLSAARRFDNLEELLANLLNARRVRISAEGGKKFFSEDYLLFRVGRILVWVKPKHKFLLRDRYYAKKVEMALKMIKPYLESFLAKSR